MPAWFSWAAIKLFFKVNKSKLVIGAIGLAVLIAGILVYGSIKYDHGYNKRDKACIEEKAADNAERKDHAIETQKNWNAISARPNSDSRALLDRMRRKDL